MKKFIMGLIVGVAIATTVSVYAEDTVEKVEAYLRPALPITLDGKEVKLDNAPVMYDGSTYLKLRDVAKITGMGVDWNQETQTVQLTSSGTEVKPVETASTSPVETTFQGLRAVTVNGETYFSLKAYSDKFDPYIWGYEASTKTIFLAETEKGSTVIKRKLIEISRDNPIDFTIYKGESFINEKYYEEH